MIVNIFLTAVAALIFSMIFLTLIGPLNNYNKVTNIIINILEYIGGASLLIMGLSLYAGVVKLIWS